MQTSVKYLIFQDNFSKEDFELCKRIADYIGISLKKEQVVNLQYEKFVIRDNFYICFGKQPATLIKNQNKEVIFFELPKLSLLHDFPENEKNRKEALSIFNTIKLLLTSSNQIINSNLRYALLLTAKEVAAKEGIDGFLLDDIYVYLNEPSVLYEKNISLDSAILAQITKEVLQFNGKIEIKKHE